MGYCAYLHVVSVYINKKYLCRQYATDEMFPYVHLSYESEYKGGVRSLLHASPRTARRVIRAKCIHEYGTF